MDGMSDSICTTVRIGEDEKSWIVGMDTGFFLLSEDYDF